MVLYERRYPRIMIEFLNAIGIKRKGKLNVNRTNVSLIGMEDTSLKRHLSCIEKVWRSSVSLYSENEPLLHRESEMEESGEDLREAARSWRF